MKNTEEETLKGTTTVGIVCKEGIVLAADRRATAGFIVNKKARKIIQINESMAVTMAGLVSDAQLLSKLGIVHGYGDRHTKLHTEIAIPQQVHGTRIAVVTKKDQGKTISGVDGLVSKDISIGVSFADCVPILAVDPEAKIIGTAHAGWKGTLHGIAQELILAMKNAGADVKNIYISIGPHIGMCCYNVGEDRAKAFQNKF